MAAGIVTSYSHMSRIVAEPGSFVRQGQLIGYVGSSGLSTGPHLHYEVYRNGAAVNPLGVRFASRSLLEGEELERFKARLAQLMALGGKVTEQNVEGTLRHCRSARHDSNRFVRRLHFV